MRLQFITIGQNLNWPRGRLSLARKKKHRREFLTLALARVTISIVTVWQAIKNIHFWNTFAVSNFDPKLRAYNLKSYAK